jgi:hypothetical protein
MTALDAPNAVAGQRLVGEMQRSRHELVWPIELPDGRRAVLAQLVPELAAEPMLRRRWVSDMERIAALSAPALPPMLAIGPQPDPRASDAAPPWRVRLDPVGDTLEHTLQRAPLPIDEIVELGARLADAVQSCHEAGVVLRDLDPRHVVLGEQIWFTDVGQARLAILSSRTASSLLVESSPYVAPEAMLEVVVDARADVYSLGIVLWRALTGSVPFEASLLDLRVKAPPLASMRPQVPADLAALVERCILRDPEHRPPTARDVAESLRGRSTSLALAVTRAPCQACGQPMRVGLRLCLSCGKEAVQFRKARDGDPDAPGIVLDRAVEDAEFAAKLRAVFESIAVEIPKLNFLIGDQRMYDQEERGQRHTLPAVLVDGLAPETANALVVRLKEQGFKVRTSTPRQRERAVSRARAILFGGTGAVVVGTAALIGGAFVVGAVGAGAGVLALIIGAARNHQAKSEAKRVPIGRLRDAPAALPASDPLVAQIAGALAAAKPTDVRARLEEIALLVQRSCDARAELAGDASAAAEADMLTEPVRPLVELACTTAGAIAAIDTELATLDEAAIVRALARCDARREAPELKRDLLAGLDKLRELEDQRTRLFGRLLEITSLTRTAVELGLRRSAGARSADAEVAKALALLEG